MSSQAPSEVAMGRRPRRGPAGRLGALICLALLAAGALGPSAPRVSAQAAEEAPFQLAWSATTSARTTSLAWGDHDADGDLDLAVATERGARLYRNDGAGLGATAVWAAAEQTSSSSVAWGDYDGDGDLDLALGKSDGPPCLYRNDQGQLTPRSVWSPDDSASATSLAWADYDNDGDLDLAVGNYQQPSQLYHNQSGALAETASWSTPELTGTTSLAWGDYDADGDLDLALGNDRQPNRLYRNDGGALGAQPVWAPLKASSTSALAWGDYDGDGDLDLAVANLGQPSQLFRNDQGQLTPQPSWWTSPANTTSVAWADYDADGDLDLILGNSFGHANQLYRNEDGQLSQAPSPLSSELDYTTSLAWGDYDGDGDLDLAVGNIYQYQAARLYRNDVGVLGQATDWRPPVTDLRGLAWADYDNDGDLDLAAGNYQQPSQIYHNQSGTLAATPAWQAAGAANTTSVAWADYDADGDLDLALGNDQQPNQLYRNDAGQLRPEPVWSSAEADATFSVAWGDYDGDGDLDLAAGNFRAPNRIYRNDAGSLTPAAAWSAADIGYTRSLAWGDYDGDGDLDLAAGNARTANWLYRNDAGALGSAPVWSSREADFTTGVAWGDYDGDGDLDLAAGNFRTPSRLYRNDAGQLTEAAAWSTAETGSSYAVAWGDYDGDGDLDLAVGNNSIGNSSQPSALYRSQRADLSAKNTQLRAIRLVDGPPAAASFFARPQIWASPTLSLTYKLYGPAQSRFHKVRALYSLDGGDHWLPALPAAATRTSNLAASPSGVSHTFTWDIHASGVMGQSDTVVLRLIAISSAQTSLGQAAGPFLHGASSATSLPFRLRGSQVRVLQDGRPAPGALVYRLAPGQVTRGPAYADLAAVPFRTDAQGYLQGRGALQLGDQLVALAPISSTTGYTLYYTNAIPGTNGLKGDEIVATGVQTLTVTPAHPLLVFDLTASLEWDARRDQAFLDQLEFDLTRAAEYLYDWSNGQIALGQITVHHDRELWHDADIRVYASNRFYPNAAQGGLGTTERADPAVPQLSYAPGQVRIGAVWNRFGSEAGRLSEDWPRVLAHELAHYALYLDDNYLGLDASGQLISVESCPGVMSDPYRNDDYSEFHPAAGWLPACERTLSHQLTGRSDWETITAFYPWLHAPQTTMGEINPGPGSLPLALTQVRFQDPPAAPATLEVPVFYLTEGGSRVEPGPQARAFLYQNHVPDPLDETDHVVELGRPAQDSLNARGARPGDRICVYEGPASRLGCANVSATSDQLELVSIPSWQPDVLISPVTSDTLKVEVLNAPAGQQLHARLYPAGSAAPAAITLAEHNGTYVGSFVDLAEPAFEGHVQIWQEEGATPGQHRRESLVDFTLGGNPGRMKLGGGRMKLGGAPMRSANGQVLLFGPQLSLDEGQLFALQSTTALPEVPGWATVIGPAYHLATSGDATWLRGTSLSFSYAESDIPAGQERWLKVYYWDEAAQPRWRVLTTTLDMDHNRVSAPTQGAGRYALMTSVELELAQGWNLLAYPIQETRAVDEALSSIAGDYTVIYGYEPADAADPWKLYAPEVPSWVNDLDALRFGRGYWVHLLVPATLRLRAASAPSTSPMPEALAPALLATAEAPQSIGAQTTPLWLPPATYYGSIQTTDLAAGAGSLAALVQGGPCGQAQLQQADGQVRYVVAVTAGDGCGTHGTDVHFLLGGRPLRPTGSWQNEQVQELQLQPGFKVLLPTIATTTP